MQFRTRLLCSGWLAFSVSSSLLRADPGDVENSHDYAAFPRLPGFVITDYDEDNPSVFNYPVARPLPIDSDHIETVQVTGHRYVIRYELGAGGASRSLLQTQRYYEKFAASSGFIAEKTGAVGDVNETFVQQNGNRFVWVYLEPGSTTTCLTIMESSVAPPPQPAPPAPPPVVAATAPVAPVPPPAPPTPPPVVAATAPVAPVPPPAPPAPPPVVAAPVPPVPTPAPDISTEGEDPLYTTLMQDGHVALPLTFLPGKPDLDADSKPVIDRIVVILKLHPDLRIEIDGHTDNYGSEEENQYISTQRALTVRGMLVASHISRKRLTAVGKGGSQPVADNATAEGREKNRRIELVLRKDSARKDVSADDSAQDQDDDSPSQDSTAFHASAPNGKNYYPSAAGSPSEADSSR